MLLHERLKTLRKATGCTLAEASEANGLSISYLSDLERGRTVPSLEALNRLAHSYNVDIVTLLIVVDLDASLNRK